MQNLRLAWACVLAFARPLMGATAGQPVTVTRFDWTVTADPVARSLSVSHTGLGLLLTNVQLQVETDQGQSPTQGWVVEQSDTGQLIIRAAEPRSTWVLTTGKAGLTVSSTAPGAVLTANLPISKDRTVARLLDPEGLPVEWTGTGEVAGGYGGSMTRHPSYLPRHNPECMYFALGNVSATFFHSLFDRKTDTAIRFPDQARLSRSDRVNDTLELVVPVCGSLQVRLVPDYFTKNLGLPSYVPFDEKPFPRPPMVWCSWTSYYGDVTEPAVVTNTDWLAEHLQPYGFQYVQLDDGYDRGLPEGHYWIKKWDSQKFPHGPNWLANYIRSKGLHPGIWLVPNAYAGAVEAHPEWYLRDKQGKIILDYGTPALDSTHPEVLAFLKHLFTTLKGWGFEYYKFDGEHALPKYVPAVNREKLYDPAVDPIVAYRRRLEVIRQTIGADSFIECCPAGTPLNAIGLVNSYFNGEDGYNNWHGMYSLFSSINANAFLNRMVVYVMPGEGMDLGELTGVEAAVRRRPPEVIATARQREEPLIGFGVTTAEARTVVSVVALTGVAYPLAGVMPELPTQRIELLQKTLPTMAISPMDLFSRGNDLTWSTFKRIRADDYIHHYPEIIDLKVHANFGDYDVVALPDWRSTPVTKTVSLPEKLGLDPGREYLVFDFWNQKMLGVNQNRLAISVEGHDTQVLLVHPKLNHPQLIGTSRHITGTYSIAELEWDSARNELRGASETVPGQSYTLFLYVTESFSVSSAHATTDPGGDRPVSQQQKGNLLSLTFAGCPQLIRWKVDFSTNPGR